MEKIISVSEKAEIEKNNKIIKFFVNIKKSLSIKRGFILT
tara:strand:+ start:101 stop:220 length:120 start_codon:yes stop_codon:yes gene_type:complete